MSEHTRRTFLKQAAGAVALGGVVASRSTAAETRFSPPMAVCNETFGDWPFDKAFALAAECGYTGLEIAPFTIANYVTDIPAERRAKVRRQAEKAGLKVIGLHWLLAKTEGFHLTSPDGAVRRKTADYLGELARFCADLGGTLLVFGSPQQRNIQPGVSRQQGMKYATDVFQSVMPVMEKTGMVVALEPLSSKTTNFLSTAAEGAELAQRVASPHCRLHLDVLAMSSEPTPIPELIRKHREILVHFHANDPNGQGPGFGKVDFVPIFQALAEIDYGGWVSVEVFNTSPGPERIARESIEYMKRTLAQLKREPVGYRNGRRFREDAGIANAES